MLWLNFIFVSIGLFFHEALSAGEISVPNRKDVEFRTADVISILSLPTGTSYTMEAYKSVQDNSTQVPKLWVSLGAPRLMLSKSNSVPFFFDNEGVHVYIDTLTDIETNQLAKSASDKYKTKIEPSQFLPMTHLLERFTGKLHFTNINQTHEFTILGEVGNLLQSPLRMNFGMKENSDIYKSMWDAVNANKTFTIQCEVTSIGERNKINRVVILGSQVENLEVTDKLFGGASSVYVSRDQLALFSAAVVKSLQITEEYDIPEEKFTEEFLNSMIQLVTEQSFQPVSFETAIASLSKFALDFKGDLKADEIKKDMGSVFTLEQKGDKKYIKVVKDNLEQLKKKFKFDGSYSTSGSAFGMFSADLEANVAIESESDWLKHDKSLDEQLTDINTKSQTDKKWAIEGEKIVPKSLNVAKLLKGKFSSSFRVERMAMRRNDQSFAQKFSLYTSDIGPIQPTLDVLVQRFKGNIEATMATLRADLQKLSDSTVKLQSDFGQVQASSTKFKSDVNSGSWLQCIDYDSPRGQQIYKAPVEYMDRLPINCPAGYLLQFAKLNRLLPADWSKPTHVEPDLTDGNFKTVCCKPKMD